MSPSKTNKQTIITRCVKNVLAQPQMSKEEAQRPRQKDAVKPDGWKWSDSPAASNLPNKLLGSARLWVSLGVMWDRFIHARGVMWAPWPKTSLLQFLPKKPKHVSTDTAKENLFTCTWICTAALCAIGQKGQEPRRPSTDGRMDKMWPIPTTDKRNKANKRNKVQKKATNGWTLKTVHQMKSDTKEQRLHHSTYTKYLEQAGTKSPKGD